MTTTGIEVHYMDRGYSLFTWSDGRNEFLFTDETGHHTVEAASYHQVAEWLDTTGRDDTALLDETFYSMQNGIGAPHNVSEQLKIRSMMVGDLIILQTNNRGPKRTYRVAPIGFDRI